MLEIRPLPEDYVTLSGITNEAWGLYEGEKLISVAAYASDLNWLGEEIIKHQLEEVL